MIPIDKYTAEKRSPWFGLLSSNEYNCTTMHYHFLIQCFGNPSDLVAIQHLVVEDNPVLDEVPLFSRELVQQRVQPTHSATSREYKFRERRD